MYGKQNVLDCVLDIARVTMPRCCKGTQIRRHLLEQAAMGTAVAILGAGHQYRPFEVAVGGRRPVWTVFATARRRLQNSDRGVEIEPEAGSR